MSHGKNKNKPVLPVNAHGQLIDPFTGKRLVPIKELEEAIEKIPSVAIIKEADRIFRERIARGDIRLSRAVKETGIKKNFILSAIAKIKPEQYYLPDGSLPQGKSYEETILGGELVFQHPINPTCVCITPGLLNGIKKEFDKSDAPSKPAGYWSSSELSKKLSGGKKGAYLMRTFKQILEAGATQVNYHGLAIPGDAFIQYTCANRNQPIYAISEYWGQKIVDLYHHLADKPEHMLSFSAFCRRVGTGGQNPRAQEIRALFDQCIKQFDDPERRGKPISVNDIEVDCGYFRSRTGQDVFCINQDMVEFLNLEIPTNPGHMLSFSSFCYAASVGLNTANGRKIRELFESAEQKFNDTEQKNTQVTVNNAIINCGYFRSGGNIVFCIDQAVIKKIGLHQLPAKPASMLSYNFFVRAAGSSRGFSKGNVVRELFDECERQFDDTKRNGKPIIVDGVEIKCGRYQSGTIEVFCIDKSMIDILNLRLRDKPEHMLPITVFIRKAGMSPNKPASYDKVAKIFNECQRQFDDPMRNGKPVVVNGMEIKCGYFRHGKGDVFCLDESVMKPLNLLLPDKPEYMLSYTSFCERIGVDLRSPKGRIIEMLFDACDQECSKKMHSDGPIELYGLKIDGGRFKSGVHKRIYISETSIPEIKMWVESEYAQQNKDSIASNHVNNIPSKSIKPGSKHLDRTGRSRGISPDDNA